MHCYIIIFAFKLYITNSKNVRLRYHSTSDMIWDDSAIYPTINTCMIYNKYILVMSYVWWKDQKMPMNSFTNQSKLKVKLYYQLPLYSLFFRQLICSNFYQLNFLLHDYGMTRKPSLIY